ncbi:hypothetical protein C8J57DRAFT_1244158 [Mycena rebaudengoi]|nr:hypothetical protein C8J57DRAFT_1244158 [Mycena rebaudengoi]
MPPPKMGTLEYEVGNTPQYGQNWVVSQITAKTLPRTPSPHTGKQPLAPGSRQIEQPAICSPYVQQVKKAFLAPLELKPPDHSGDVTQLGKNCLRFGFLSYLPIAHTATNCGSCASTASQHCPATAEQFRTHYANTPAAPHSCRQVPNTKHVLRASLQAKFHKIPHLIEPRYGEGLDTAQFPCGWQSPFIVVRPVLARWDSQSRQSRFERLRKLRVLIKFQVYEKGNVIIDGKMHTSSET